MVPNWQLVGTTWTNWAAGAREFLQNTPMSNLPSSVWVVSQCLVGGSSGEELPTTMCRAFFVRDTRSATRDMLCSTLVVHVEPCELVRLLAKLAYDLRAPWGSGLEEGPRTETVWGSTPARQLQRSTPTNNSNDQLWGSTRRQHGVVIQYRKLGAKCAELQENVSCRRGATRGSPMFGSRNLRGNWAGQKQDGVAVNSGGQRWRSCLAVALGGQLRRSHLRWHRASGRTEHVLPTG